jgi:hypothetical protein
MSSIADKESAAAGLRGCAADLEVVFDGLAVRSKSAWTCPAAVAFETDLRYQVSVLESVAAGLRESATSLEAAAEAPRAAAEEAVVAVDPGAPPPIGGWSSPPPPSPATVSGPA